MAPAVRPLGSPSIARGCARIDCGPDTAKIGSADRVEVHSARLLAVIGVRKTFPHGLGPKATSPIRAVSVSQSDRDQVGVLSALATSLEPDCSWLRICSARV
jgi:hypothetical protein